MWKLIDCGTYLWFVKQASKYFHCIKATNGEHKKIHRKATRQSLYSGRDSMAVAYLRNWNLENTPSSLVINSRRAGRPDSFIAWARLKAGIISSGSVTFSE